MIQIIRGVKLILKVRPTKFIRLFSPACQKSLVGVQPSYPNPHPVLAQNMRPSEVNILFKHFQCFVNLETEYPTVVGASFVRLPCYDCSLELHTMQSKTDTMQSKTVTMQSKTDNLQIIHSASLNILPSGMA